MSERAPTTFPKEERGRPVLVANEETGKIDVLRTMGKRVDGEIAGVVREREVVGLDLNTNNPTSSMDKTKFVESSDLQPEAQAHLARELSGLPLHGDTVHGLFEGKIVDSVVGDHKIDEVTGQTMIEITSKESGDSKWADIRAFSPEIQAQMEAEKETRNAKVGEGALKVVDIKVGPIESSIEETTPSNKYDALVRGEVEGSVEDAAVVPVESDEDRSLRELRAHHQKVAQDGEIQTRADFYRDGHK